MPQRVQEPPSTEPDDVVGPLGRGLTVLRAMTASSVRRQRPSDLVRATGLARSTVDRIATTLVHLGYLRAEDRDLVLTPKLMAVGNDYLACSQLPDAAAPHAAALAEELDESVSIAVPDGDGVRFVTQVIRRRTVSLAFRIGDLLPAERCAPGPLFAPQWTEEVRRSWLARLREDPMGLSHPAVPPRDQPADPEQTAARFDAQVDTGAEQGWALDDQLIEPGLIAVSLPVRDASGTVVCAVSVVSHTSRHSAESLARHALPHMRGRISALEASLRAAPTHLRHRPGDSANDDALKEELGPEFLQSLARGLAVLRALGSRTGGLTLSEAAEATGQARATARRSLITLHRLGYVHAEGRNFVLTPRVLELGYAPLSALSFEQIVRPHLTDLTALLGESSSVAVLDGDDVRYVARVATARIMSVNIAVGTRFPAYATSMGRVLLAGLPRAERAAYFARIRPEEHTMHTRTGIEELSRIVDAAGHDGYALVDQELEEGLRSIA
ncbi:MAG: IclR family transcriptional regulator, pca regulon regulatory protein, partial [Streptomyces sp.]|nr:IclR family transcriptional regulator, pca regulon regulatory protein [Streptomyces sp.]